ncbi:MAG: hypothetical protein ABSH51_29515 [Solirubrobacteraceae bacterium]|jgi:uncharacterized protein YigA (DUF484 family)
MSGRASPGGDAESQAGLREQNAVLRERLQRAERFTARALMRATRLAQVIAVLGNESDLQTTTGRVAVGLAELFSSDMALLLLESDRGLRIEGQWGIKSGDVPPSRIVHVADALSR